MHIVYWQGYIIQKKLPFSTSEKSLLHKTNTKQQAKPLKRDQIISFFIMN